MEALQQSRHDGCDKWLNLFQGGLAEEHAEARSSLRTDAILSASISSRGETDRACSSFNKRPQTWMTWGENSSCSAP